MTGDEDTRTKFATTTSPLTETFDTKTRRLAEAYSNFLLPDFDTADTPFIMSGFRPQLSLSGCICSMFSFHNQVVNIWTSLVLIAFNLYICSLFSKNDDIPLLILIVFWAHGVLRSFCWFNSWAYHTFNCYSQEMASFLVKMVYIGCYLTPLGVGSNTILIELYCQPAIAWPILGVGMLCIMGSIVVALSPRYQSEKFRSLRLFLSLGAMVPYVVGLVIAICVVHDYKIPSYYQYLFYGFCWEILGAFFYTSMLPEKLYPQYFDSILSSHSLWHWCNFGFDFFNLYFAYLALLNLRVKGYC